MRYWCGFQQRVDSWKLRLLPAPEQEVEEIAVKDEEQEEANTEHSESVSSCTYTEKSETEEEVS